MDTRIFPLRLMLAFTEPLVVNTFPLPPIAWMKSGALSPVPPRRPSFLLIVKLATPVVIVMETALSVICRIGKVGWAPEV